MFAHAIDPDRRDSDESDQDSDTAEIPAYNERVQLVRTSFPDRDGMSETAATGPTETSVGSGKSTAPKADKPLLPWHPAHGNYANMHQALLTGEPLPSEDKSSGPLERRAYFHTPTFNNSFYQIKSSHTEPPHLPTGFEALQAKAHQVRLKRPNLKAPPVSVPFKLTRDIDTQIRRSLRVASYQEWFLGTSRHQLEILAKSLAESPHEPASTLVPQIQAVLLSGIKATSDIHAVLEYLHHNWTLLRRDSYLETLDYLIPADHVTTLRRHDLTDEQNLFGVSDIQATHATLDKLKNERSVLQALRHSPKSGSARTSPRHHQNRSPRGGHHSPRSGGNYGNNNNNANHNNNNGRKWSPRGRGKPKQSGPRDGNGGK